MLGLIKTTCVSMAAILSILALGGCYSTPMTYALFTEPELGQLERCAVFGLDGEQEQIFIYAKRNQNKHPWLRLLNSSLCGVRLMPGQRLKAKRQGMPKGFPDINLPIVCYPWHGLYIELKRVKGGVISPEQKWWLKKLSEQGYLAVVAKGHNEAIKIIKNYLGI